MCACINVCVCRFNGSGRHATPSGVRGLAHSASAKGAKRNLPVLRAGPCVNAGGTNRKETITLQNTQRQLGVEEVGRRASNFSYYFFFFLDQIRRKRPSRPDVLLSHNSVATGWDLSR